MLPTLISDDDVVRKCNTHQQVDKNGRDSVDDKSHHKPSMTPQGRDELSEAATKIRQSLSNRSLPVSAAYMATKEYEATHPVINDVRTLQVSEQRKTQQGINTSVSNPPCVSSQQTTNSTSQPVYNGRTVKTTQVIPQRPQDLLENVPLDLVRVNVKSSAQYRKSYAFKIWRDKGSFPYRVAEQPVVKEVVERKKSKKHLNAVRAQKDRENEEAWKAFKNCRSTNNEMKYRRSSKLQSRVDETLIKRCEKQQLNMILSDGQENDSKARNKKQQNSIPDYFKNKKEPTSKYLPPTSPTKSIPTSVIHVNTTKASQVSTQTIQAEQRMFTSDETVYNDDVLKPTKQTVIPLTLNPTSKEVLLADNKDEYSSTSQWSSAQTSSAGKYNIENVECQKELNANPTASDIQQISVQTMACDRSAETSSGPGETLYDTVQSLQQENGSSMQYTSRSLTMNFNRLHDNLVLTAEKDTEQLSRECNSKSDQSSNPPSPVVEASVNSQIDNSNLASIIKNSLAKKYSKENMRPTVGSGERRRKRCRNDSANSEAEERQRAGLKQQKVTMFTRLDEAVATNLADGIHNVNSEYFPIEALANKAAKETSKSVSDGPECNLETASIQHKLNEIERARLLLKELFDVTSESGGDNEMKTFDVESRSFGRKNILNHLSLIDRYFAEFQKKLSCTDG